MLCSYADVAQVQVVCHWQLSKLFMSRTTLITIQRVSLYTAVLNYKSKEVRAKEYTIIHNSLTLHLFRVDIRTVFEFGVIELLATIVYKVFRWYSKLLRVFIQEN